MNDAFKLPHSLMMCLWIGLAFYMITMLLIGFLSSKRISNMTDFLVAGRKLPFWMATATLLATWFGAGSAMGVSATVYTKGVRGVIADPFGASLSLILAGIFIVGLLRRMKCLTVVDSIREKFGVGPSIYAAIWMIPVYVGWLGAQLLGIGTLLQVVTGIQAWKCTLIGAAVILIYTYAGGMWAVTLTDVVQVSIIILGLGLIAPGAISECGGFSAFMASIHSPDISLLPQSLNSVNDCIRYVGDWIIMGLGCMVGQDVIQRSLASKNERVAISSSIVSGVLYMIIGLIPILIGLTARTVLAKYGVSIDANQVLPQMAMIILGKTSSIMLIMFMAALVSAIMSSADSSLLAGTSLIINNVAECLCPNLTDRRKLLITRVTTVLMTLLSLYLAMSCDSIYELMINCWASQLVVVFIPVIASLYLPKSSTLSIWCTMLVASAVWLIYSFIADTGFKTGLGDNCGAVYGFLAGLLTFIVFTIFRKVCEARGCK